VIESIAFLLAVNIEAICAAGGPRPETILATGGLARLDGLCQRLADVSGLVVERPEALEATSQGVACLLGSAIRAIPALGRFGRSSADSLLARYIQTKALLSS
jgi:sugar (pentulose or hexulose) kinase